MSNRTRPRAVRALRDALASARLTRFVTQDQLGDWWIVRPLIDKAAREEEEEIRKRTGALLRHPSVKATREAHALSELQPRYDSSYPYTVWARAAAGIECHYCVGFWIGLAVLAARPLERLPVGGALYSLVMDALALNYVLGATEDAARMVRAKSDSAMDRVDS